MCCFLFFATLNCSAYQAHHMYTTREHRMVDREVGYL
jgi:hypothetical protein